MFIQLSPRLHWLRSRSLKHFELFRLEQKIKKAKRMLQSYNLQISIFPHLNFHSLAHSLFRISFLSPALLTLYLSFSFSQILARSHSHTLAHTHSLTHTLAHTLAHKSIQPLTELKVWNSHCFSFPLYYAFFSVIIMCLNFMLLLSNTIWNAAFLHVNETHVEQNL